MTHEHKPRRMARQPITLEGQGTAPVAADAPAPTMLAAAEQRPIKHALVLDLLRREGGALLKIIVAATGWQGHTARAALTGLRKQGHAIARSTVDGERRYALSDGPAR